MSYKNSQEADKKGGEMKDKDNLQTKKLLPQKSRVG